MFDFRGEFDFPEPSDQLFESADLTNLAEGVINVASDVRNRANQFLPVLALFNMEGGSPELTDLQNSSNRDEQNAAIPMSTLLESTEEADQQAARQLSTMLSGSAEQRQFAVAILNRLDGGDRHRMLQIVSEQPQAADRLRLMLCPTDPTWECEGAQRLLQLLSDREPLGRAVLEGLQAGGQRADAMNHMVEFNFDADEIEEYTRLPAAAQERVRALLTSSEISAVPMTRHLLSMLASLSSRENGEQLLNMLGGSETERADARNLLQYDPDTLQAFFRQDQPTQNRLRTMLRSEGAESTAAGTLISMLAGDDQARTTGELLRNMLNGSDAERSQANVILGLHDADHRNTILRLRTRSNTLFNNVVEMLSGAETQRTAGENLLQQMGRARQSPLEQQSLSTLTGMLNNPERRELATRILAHGDEDERTQLAQLCGTGRQLAAERLLTMRQSDNRNIRAGAELLINSVASDGTNRSNRLSQESTARLMGFLSSTNPDQVETATRILQAVRSYDPFASATHTQSIEQLVQLSARTTVSGNPDPHPLNTMLSMLETRRGTASGLLAMLGQGEQAGQANTLIEMMRTETGSQQATTLLSLRATERTTLLALPVERRQAVFNLLMPRNNAAPQDANDPLANRSNAERYAIGQSLLQDLNGSRFGFDFDGSDSLRRSLVGPLRTTASNDAIVSNATRLLSMLTSRNATEAGTAATILSTLPDSEARNNMLGVMYGDTMQSQTVSPEGQRLLTMLRGNERERERAQLLLTATESPRQARLLMELAAGNAQQRGQAESLTDLLRQEPVVTRQIMRLLFSQNPAHRQAGAQALDLVANRPNGFDRTAAGNETITLLGLAQSNNESVALMQLRAEQPRAYERINALLNTSSDCNNDAFRIVETTQRFLESLANGHPISRRIATWLNNQDHGTEADLRVAFVLMDAMGRHGEAVVGRYLDTLQNTDAGVRTQMRAAIGRPGLDGLLGTLDGLLQGPQTGEAGTRLLSMLSTGNVSEQQGARSLLRLLNGSPVQNDGGRMPVANNNPDSGRRLVSRLQNPQTAEETRELLSLVQNPNQLAGLFTLPDNPARSELLRMLRSNGEERQAARNFLDVYAFDSGVTIDAFDRGGNNSDNVSSEILAMLSDNTRRPEALSLLMAGAAQPGRLRQLGQMMMPIRGRDGQMTENPLLGSARWLLQALADRDRGSSIQPLLDRLDPDRLHQAVVLLSSQDPGLRACGEHVQTLLLSDNKGSAAGFNALSILANRATRENGLRVLRMLTSDNREHEELAMEFLLVPPFILTGHPQLTALVADPRYVTASRFLIEHLGDRTDRESIESVDYLLRLLAGESTRADGERLRDLLNDSSQQYAALRELQRRRPQPPPQTPRPVR